MLVPSALALTELLPSPVPELAQAASSSISVLVVSSTAMLCFASQHLSHAEVPRREYLGRW